MNKNIEKPIQLLPGCIIKHNNDQYVITHILDLEHVLAKHAVSKRSKRIPIVDIQHETIVLPDNLPKDLNLITDEDWHEANRRFQIIKPIIESDRGQRVTRIKAAAKEHSTSPATIYRWIASWEKEKRVSGLIRPTRKDKGASRTNPEVEEIIRKHIKSTFLTDQKLNIVSVHEYIESECRDMNLPVPHINTLRNRISLISDEEKTLKRLGKDAARDKYRPSVGSFPGADFPLAVVQIDHTPMDIIIVDEKTRKPTKRPILTLGLDVNSKVTHGYYIGMDPPGDLSTGLCIAHGVLPKENWLATMDITTPYPVWGKMRVIHTDNAKEFKSKMLHRACNEHGIILEKRPKGQPNYGGGIESAFRTFMKKVHTLPGTTYSNIQDKGEYNSEGKACMTYKALLKWFAIFIVEYYHQKPHSGNNGFPPIIAYERGLLGSEDKPGIGLPERITDEYKFKLDFMPYEMRTVQQYGILMNNMFYYDEHLNRWINSIDPKNVKLKRKFICRYDPRDLSTIHFHDPDTDSYLEIPYRDITHPPISIWELRAIRKKLKEEGHATVNEDLIFSALKKMRDIVQQEQQETKSARILRSRQKNWKDAKKHTAKDSTIPESGLAFMDPLDDIFSQPVQPFEDIEEAS